MEKWIECCERDGTTTLRPLSQIGYVAKIRHNGEKYFSFSIKDTMLKYGTPLQNMYDHNVYDLFLKFLEDNTSIVFQINGTFILL